MCYISINDYSVSGGIYHYCSLNIPEKSHFLIWRKRKHKIIAKHFLIICDFVSLFANVCPVGVTMTTIIQPITYIINPHLFKLSLIYILLIHFPVLSCDIIWLKVHCGQNTFLFCYIVKCVAKLHILNLSSCWGITNLLCYWYTFNLLFYRLQTSYCNWRDCLSFCCVNLRY